MTFLILIVITTGIAEQTDWMGGTGVWGPVTNWGTRYYAGDSVTPATEGQVSLIATQWDYSASGWVKHIVESNSGILHAAQGFMPGDIDADDIVDLVTHTADEVVWYKHNGYYSFSKNVIGPAQDEGGECPCVYPCDLDKDGDIDVLVAAQGIGVGWYENTSWIYHSLDNSTDYHRVSATDVELDGDIDVIAVDNSGSWYNAGDICLFRDTTGTQEFKKELVVDLPSYEGWRAYPADFNNDGYPDIYSVHHNSYVFLNDGTGHFTQSFYADYWPSWDFDGAWPSDIDMDGDIDLVCGVIIGNTSAVGLYGLLNDGTGSNFDSLFLVGTGSGIKNYGDGSMARDIDLDGLPDIAGTYTRVGWFRQDSLLAFTLHDIDNISSGESHWVYATPLGNKCAPSIDLLVTHTGAHIVYENQMLKAFGSIGWLESSVLELPGDTFDLKYFGYSACVPNDTALAFYWKAGVDSADIVNQGWDGPHSVTTVTDSFVIGINNKKMFQYKVEFKGDDDIAVLNKIWLNYGSIAGGIEENSKVKLQNAKLKFLNDGRLIVETSNKDKVALEIYDVMGRLVKNVFTGSLDSGSYEFRVLTKSGVYFAVLRYTGGNEKLKFVRF